jgi:hypothetical protein
MAAQFKAFKEPIRLEFTPLPQMITLTAPLASRCGRREIAAAEANQAAACLYSTKTSSRRRRIFEVTPNGRNARSHSCKPPSRARVSHGSRCGSR